MRKIRRATGQGRRGRGTEGEGRRRESESSHSRNYSGGNAEEIWKIIDGEADGGPRAVAEA